LRAVSYSYGDAGQMESVADASRTYLDGLKYAAHGDILSETFGNNTVHTLSYNTRLQPTQVKLTSGATVLQRFDYAYGEVDATTGAVDATKNTGQVARAESYIGSAKQWQKRFSYDHLGRLTLVGGYQGSTNVSSYQADYTFDRYGNRFQSGAQNTGLAYTPVVTADIDAATNRFKSTANATMTYDEAGNLTYDGKFGGQYRYNAQGRQTWSAYNDGTNPLTAIYDGVGERVEVTVGGETRQRVYDAFGQLIAQYKQGTLESEHIYRGGQEVATVGAQVQYVLRDIQGSAQVVMDESATVVMRHDYLPYGEEVLPGTGGPPSGSTTDATQTRQRYAGTERDVDSGLDHTWWRKYRSAAGRWTSPDPYNGSMGVGDPQSLNRYAYVQNDPASLVDPSGLLLVCFWTFTVIETTGYIDLSYCEWADDPVRHGDDPRNPREMRRQTTTQTADECRADALRKLADELGARSDLYPSTGGKLFSILSGGRAGAAAGGYVLGPGGAVLGAGIGATVGAAISDVREQAVERRPVANFNKRAKACDKIAKREARERQEASKNGPFVSGSTRPPQMFVVTRQFGVFALYPYTLVRGPTLVGDFIREEHGANPTDPVTTSFSPR
jgi:RHS repeat-associated protein